MEGTRKELIKEVNILINKEEEALSDWRKFRASKRTGRLRAPDDVIYNFKYLTIIKMKEILKLILTI